MIEPSALEAQRRWLEGEVCSRCGGQLAEAEVSSRLCNRCRVAVQKEAQEADRALRPSLAIDSGWIWSYECPSLTDRRASPPRTKVRNAGKWLLFVSPEDIDEVWQKIVRAEQEGRLGAGCKVSTANGRGKKRKHVVVVYTGDHEDEADVMRVREELRRLGFVAPIAYKTDQATLEGRYEGSGRVAKWFLEGAA